MQPTEKESTSIFRWKQSKPKQNQKRPREHFVHGFPSFCFAFSALTEAEEFQAWTTGGWDLGEAALENFVQKNLLLPMYPFNSSKVIKYGHTVSRKFAPYNALNAAK